MSSTPFEVVVEQGREIGPSMSPLPPSDDEINQPRPVSSSSRAQSPSKRKTKKQGKSSGNDPTSRKGVSADVAEEEVLIAESTKTGKKSKKSKKARKNQPENEAVDEVVNGSTQPEAQPSSKRKSKKRSKSQTTPDVHPQQNGTHEIGLVNGNAAYESDEAPLEDAHQHAPGPLPTPFSGLNNSNGRKNYHNLPSPDEQPFLDSHAVVEVDSPPSAQRPSINGLNRYEPVSEGDADDDDIAISNQLSQVRARSTQPEANVIDARQVKSEGPDNDEDEDEDEDDEELQSHFAGLASASFADATKDPVAEARRDDGLNFGVAWLHKGLTDSSNDTPIIDTRADQDMNLDAALPDLEPSQVKTEPQSDTSSEDESDPESDSPAAARSDRLSQSRSRSASKASMSHADLLADQAPGLAHTARALPRPNSRQSDRASLADETASIISSSTGSNASIPARRESPAESVNSVGSPPSQPGPGTKSSRPRESGNSCRDDVRANSDPMVIDEPVATDRSSTPNTQTKKAKLARKKPLQPTDATDVDVEDYDTPEMDDASDQVKNPKQQRRRRPSNDGMPNGNVSMPGAENESQSAEFEPIENGAADDSIAAENTRAVVDDMDLVATTSQPRSSQKRKAKRSLVPDVDNADSAEAQETRLVVGSGAPASLQKKAKKRSPRKNVSPIASRAEQTIADEGQAVNGDKIVPEETEQRREDSVELGNLASQPQSKPKGKKKRKLQPKLSLSLSQIEDEDDPMEGLPKRPPFSQQSKMKSLMRVGSNEPEPSEVDASQEPAAAPAQKPRKTKRKRRTQGNESEDEMESLLAAGPSKSRKKANKIDLDDDENGRATKRKRTFKSNGEAGKGPWSEAEMGALEKVVAEFLDTYGMSQEDLNELIHEVPSKTDLANQDFWNKAADAIPHRKRKQIVERARRKFHNHVAEGAWTEEQKEEVNALFEKYGERPTYPWKEIASAINRDSKDVRDYWRNNYLVHKTQVKSRWNKEEEERLKEIVEEALNKIRIVRENDEHYKPRRRTKSLKDSDDTALIDWQQISAAMELTRSRQQCRWKWIDMREKGLAGDESIVLPTQPRSSAGAVKGISEYLANAREDYRGMSEEEKFRLIDAIHDSYVRSDGHIRWSGLVDERFRVKWKRPTLKLVWYRLRQSVPGYEDQNVNENAEYLLNHYHQHRSFPRVDDNQVNEEVEEKLVHRAPGSRVWKRPSEDPRAIRERQRRSSSASSHASTRPSSRVSGEILRIEGSDDDEEDAMASSGDDEDAEQRGRRRHVARDDVPIMIPKHLKGDSAKKALADARTKAGKAKGKSNKPARHVRSASIAVDSDSE